MEMDRYWLKRVGKHDCTMVGILEGMRMTEQNKDQRSPHGHQMKAYHEGIAQAHNAFTSAVEGRNPDATTTQRERPLTERIEDAYNRAIEQRRLLEYAQWEMNAQEEAHDGLELSAEWVSARDDRDSAELELDLARMETARLRLLVKVKMIEGCC